MIENGTKGLSYSEDFEDEKSIPLTQSAAYQKMLSTVDVSDEGEDLEDDFLEGNTNCWCIYVVIIYSLNL